MNNQKNGWAKRFDEMKITAKSSNKTWLKHTDETAGTAVINVHVACEALFAIVGSFC